jgi:hypothetical protein
LCLVIFTGMKRLFFILFLTFTASTISSGFVHKFYLSLTQVEHNAPAQTLEVAIKLFTDDLERCLGNRFRENLRLGESDEHTKTDEMLQTYLNEKLKFSLGSAALKMTLLGKEVSVDETWCYLEVTLNAAHITELKVENRIFTEVFATQINMLKFKSPVAASQDFTFNNSEFSGIIKFQ